MWALLLEAVVLGGPTVLQRQVLTFRRLCKLLFGDSPLLQGEVLPSGPDHVWVDGRPVHAQQITDVTPVVGESFLLQHVPHLNQTETSRNIISNYIRFRSSQTGKHRIKIYKGRKNNSTHERSFCVHSDWLVDLTGTLSWFYTHDAPLVLTWAVPSYEAVTSRALWCGLQAMSVILAVWPHSLRWGSVNTTGLSGGFSVQREKSYINKYPRWNVSPTLTGAGELTSPYSALYSSSVFCHSCNLLQSITIAVIINTKPHHT